MFALQPFEEYMLLDDRVNYPMTCFTRLCFAGTMETEILQAAFERAAARQPLLSSVVVEPKKGRFFWSPTERKPEFHLCQTDNADWLPHTPRIILTEEPGIRLYCIVRNLPDGTVTDLLFQIHHAACDAIGLMNLIDDCLRIYAVEIGEAEASIVEPPPNVEALERRGNRTETGRQWLNPFRLVASPAAGLAGFFRTFINMPIPLVPMSIERQSKTLPQDFPAAVVRTLDPAHFLALVAAAKRRNVTLNDLLTRDWFLALGKFRDKYYAEKSHRLIRLSIPVNLRTSVSNTQLAANNVSMVFIDRAVRKGETPETLLNSICREMKRKKYYGTALTMIRCLRFCQKIPGLLATAVHRQQKVWATSVFSNSGRQLENSPLPKRNGRICLGNAVLQRIDGIPPVRAWTAVALSVSTYAETMSLSLHYDTQFLSGEQAEELQNYFVERLLESSENKQSEPRPYKQSEPYPYKQSEPYPYKQSEPYPYKQSEPYPYKQSEPRP